MSEAGVAASAAAPSASVREQLQKRQQRWMQQRQVELDRQDARTCLALSSGTGTVIGRDSSGGSCGGGGGAGVDRVLDKLTERITERLQVEVRRENAQLLQAGDVGKQVQKYLEQHIGSNTCPICYELMAGKRRQPTLLFPCGHTFCAECLELHIRQGQSQLSAAAPEPRCPFCREPIASRAPNVSLQQVIDGFVERQRKLRDGEALTEVIEGQRAVAAASARAAAGAAAGTDECVPGLGAAPVGGGGSCSVNDGVQRYSEQFRTFSMRCHVLQNQLEELQAEEVAACERRTTATAVLSHLRAVEQAAEARVQAAIAELEVVRGQASEQEAKCETLEARQAEVAGQASLVQKTLSSLTLERDKARLLLHNYAPEAVGKRGTS